MKIDCVIPTRGNRKDFVDFAVKQIENQTFPPDFIEIVDHPPDSDKTDIASRYKIGIDRRLNAGADIIFFIEDDDFYCQNYIETMIKMWTAAGKPSLFGLDVTTYYHIGLKIYGDQSHEGRSSMYCTMMTKDFNVSNWPKDPDPFVDLKIWKGNKDKKAVTPVDTICLGIKHGQGKCAGSMHNANKFNKAFNIRHKGKADSDLSYLQKITGPGFWFYKSMINGMEGGKCR